MKRAPFLKLDPGTIFFPSRWECFKHWVREMVEGFTFWIQPGGRKRSVLGSESS